MTSSFRLEPLTGLESQFTNLRYAVGQGRLPVEVVYADYDLVPSPTQLRGLWKARQNGRGVPLVVVVLHAGVAHLCGVSGEDPTVYPSLDVGQVERICAEALAQPNRRSALRALRDSLATLEQDGLSGLRNEGFLASHDLTAGVPTRADWAEASKKGRAGLGLTGESLLRALGFTSEPLDNVTQVLKKETQKTAVAILLTDQEVPESGSPRTGNMSPVSYALARADEESLDWVVVLHDWKIRLYPVTMGLGVGSRGRTETFIECHTGLLPDAQAAYLWLLFSADALVPDGTIESIVASSKDFAGDLATQLRERIYIEVVPRLATGLADARGKRKPMASDLADTYQMAMLVLFRLLFIAYAEDKDLLPYRFNGLYQKRSLKAKAKDILTLTTTGVEFDASDLWWQEVRTIFLAVERGNRSWGVPAYNGGLFSSDPEESSIGSELETLSLPDTVFGPVLQHLLLVPTAEGVLGPVDFRALGVREFGTIYEGLLESELSVAETDLTVDIKGAYRPCVGEEAPLVQKGQVYLHNASGARKSSGSYYTKAFAVEHLLDQALEPAINDHLERLDALPDDLERAEAFFDFRVADLAMGSAHFLVAAVDRIEARLSCYLITRPLPQVTLELDQARQASQDSLGDAVDSYPDCEDTALLRRLIARRCIYGVDTNPVAVQLARLSIWIHTFVPGLPLSLLDRNLVQGNSLVGVGQLSEITDALDDNLPLLPLDTETFLGDARDALVRWGRLADATTSEIKDARNAWTDAEEAVAPTKALCDILTVSRIEQQTFPINLDEWDTERLGIVDGKAHKHAMRVLQSLHPFHFPVAFPEVFLRERVGFDVILGNPPWQEATLEEDAFWGRYRPGGLRRTLSQREQELVIARYRKDRPDLLKRFEAELEELRVTRQALMSGPYPGMGTGDPDLYKGFCWRFLSLASAEAGHIGVVLPRGVLNGKGSQHVRKFLLQEPHVTNVTVLKNNNRWVFDTHPQATNALVSIQRGGTPEPQINLSGPYGSLSEFNAKKEIPGRSFPADDVLLWNDTAAFPLLPDSESSELFDQLNKAPRLDLDQPQGWRARAHRELDATNDKKDKKTGQVLMDLESVECPDGFWPVYKGESFALWSPDTNRYYAWADPDVLLPRLQAKRVRGNRLRSSVFHECSANWCADKSTLPCLHPRLAFRDITQWNNTRSMVVSLVPPKVFLTNKAPYMIFPRGDWCDAAFLLGVLSSISFDWYVRLFVETSMNFHLLNAFPIPRPDADDPLRGRVIELAGRLACPDDRFADWAKAVGVECGPLDDDEKQDMIHELDAVVAHLYGLTKTHLVHIFETFHKGWDYHDRLDATIAHYQRWKATT